MLINKILYINLFSRKICTMLTWSNYSKYNKSTQSFQDNQWKGLDIKLWVPVKFTVQCPLLPCIRNDFYKMNNKAYQQTMYNCALNQESEGIRQRIIIWCKSPMMIYKITSSVKIIGWKNWTLLILNQPIRIWLFWGKE